MCTLVDTYSNSGQNSCIKSSQSDGLPVMHAIYSDKSIDKMIIFRIKIDGHSMQLKLEIYMHNQYSK